MQTMQLW